MKLTVLGRNGPFPAPAGACSGYLVQAGGATLVMDLGPGTLSNLRRVIPELKLDAILLSHLHSDHMADMLVLRYALPQLKARKTDVNMPLTVIAPETPEMEYRILASSGVFEMMPGRDGMRLRFGEVTVTLYGMSHPVETYAFDIAHRGRRLFYTGDTGWHPELEVQCRGADVLLADTGFLNAEKPGDTAPHMTAGEAGLLARKAGVGQLICTHIWGGSDNSAEVLKEAREHFANSLVAEEMHEYHV